MSSKKKPTSTIDKTLSDLYTAAENFSDKLAVAKLLVDIEKARLKADPEDIGDKIPEGLQD